MPRQTPKHRDVAATAAVTVVTTTETEAVQLDGVAASQPDGRVVLRGWMQFTTGAGTTAVTLRIRRGTDTTGTLVGEANAITAAASAVREMAIEVPDTPGEVAGQSYVLTVQQTAATGNGTVEQSSLEARVS